MDNFKKASDRKLINDLEQAALSMEPKVREAFLLMIATLQSNVDLKALIAAVEAKDVRRITEIVNEKAVTGAIRNFAESYQLTVETGAAVVIENLPIIPDNVGNPISVRFNVTNPRTASFLNDYKFNKIREIGMDIQETIRQTAIDGILSGSNPIETARRIRDNIGLTDSQAKAVANYKKSLESLNTDALVRRLRDKRFDPTVARAIKDGKPLTPEKIEAMVKRYREKYIKHRAEVIAKTESIRAIQAGQQLLWQQMVDEGDVSEKKINRKWITSDDLKVRNSHFQIPIMNKDGVALNEPFKSPLGDIMFPGDPSARAANTINCLHPDNVVMADNIRAISKREYNGEVITIKTSMGYKTTVTPNHPILTNMGWLRAAEINKTHKVFCDPGFNIGSISGLNVKKVIPTIENVYKSIKGIWLNDSLPNKKIIMDFHGDISDGEINIIRPAGCLPFISYTSRIKDFSERLLLPARMRDYFFSCFSALHSAFYSLFGSPNGSMSLSNLSFSAFIRHFLPFSTLRFALIPGLNAALPQNSINNGSADGVYLGKLIDGKTPGVLSDNVTDIIRTEFNGHVYNLETDSGLYTANGIVQHNCRCTIVTRLVD